MENSSDVLHKLGCLGLTEAEKVTLQIDVAQEQQDFEHAVVCRLLTTKLYNSKAFVNTMGAAWRTSQLMHYENLGNNTFLFEFSCKKDKDKVLKGGPWNFRNCPLLFLEYDANIRTIEMVFKYLTIWIRIYDLPLGCRSIQVVKAIGDMCGVVEECDKEVWGEFVRVKVCIDVTKPLCRGVLIKTPNMRSEGGDWYPLKYEKLAHFCFLCGLLGVEVCSCHKENTSEEEHLYTEDLRAPGTNPEYVVNRISKQERRKGVEKEVTTPQEEDIVQETGTDANVQPGTEREGKNK